MKTNHKPFARKFRQFNYQAKKLKQLHAEGKFEELSGTRQRIMIVKFKRLYLELRGKLQHWRLKKILTGLSFLLLGLGGLPQANAQTFGAAQLNPFGLIPAYGYNLVTMADIDNDGDTDLFVMGYDDSYNSAVFYMENIGTPTSPSFEDPTENPFNLQTTGIYITTGTFADIDNDGDLDFFTGTYYDNIDGSLYFFENSGTFNAPSFESPELNPFGFVPTTTASIPEFADIDGDGDLDLFVGADYGTIQFFENTGSSVAAIFGTPEIAPFGITSPPGAYSFMDFADMDGDGDLDLMMGSIADYYSYLANFYFEENTGTATAPAFDNDLVQDPFGLEPVETYYTIPSLADIDGDGDLDLFSSASENGIFFFENLGTAPTSADAMVETFISTPYPFAEADFDFMDPDGDNFNSIKIVGLTSVGMLQLNATDVSLDDVIPIADIPFLIFTPIDGEEGASYDSFVFQVGDDGNAFSTDYTMTINVGGVSTKDNLLNASLQVFPNPTANLINLKLEAVNTLNDIQIKLIDDSGRLLAQQSTNVTGSTWQQQLDISKIIAGLYFIQINADGKTISRQFVKN